jgi:hypothetical protein
MTDVTRHIPASTQLLAARLMMRSEMAGRMTNVCISNVPGPQVPVYMNGAKLVTQMGLGPLSDRMGLFIAVTSQNGSISFSATSCRRTMPDIDFFMECIRESFSELKATSAVPAPKVKPKSAVKKATKKLSKKAASNKKTATTTNRKKTSKAAIKVATSVKK